MKSRKFESLESRRLLAVAVEVLAPTSGDFADPGSNTTVFQLGQGVHVRASEATLSSHPSDVWSYDWSFSDPDATDKFKDYPGFNAARLYKRSGARVIKLTLSDPRSGATESDSVAVKIESPNPSSVKRIYVDGVSGNDTLSGASESSAVRSINRALGLITEDNTRVLLKRGTIIPALDADLPTITRNNIWIGSEPTFALSGRTNVLPTVLAASGVRNEAIFKVDEGSRNVTFEDFKFDSARTTYGDSTKPDVFSISGANVVVDGIDYDHVTRFGLQRGSAKGVLVTDTEAKDDDSTAKYGWYINNSNSPTSSQGTTILGNVFRDPNGEHVIRIYGDFVNVRGNDLTAYATGNRSGGTTKTGNGLRVNQGRHIYWSNNILRGTTINVGPLKPDADGGAGFKPGAEVSDVVVEGNYLYIAPYESSTSNIRRFEVLPGSHRVSIRNNIIESPDAIAFKLELGPLTIPDPRHQIVASDIDLVNNTVINEPTGDGIYKGFNGGFAKVTGSQQRVLEMRNNLYVAPEYQVPGPYGNAAVNITRIGNGPPATEAAFVLGGISNNVWTDSGTGPGERGLHFIDGSGTSSDKYQTPAEWRDLAATANGSDQDLFRDIELDSERRPLALSTDDRMAIQTGSPAGSITADFFGDPRPASGPWSVGAVNLERSPDTVITTIKPVGDAYVRGGSQNADKNYGKMTTLEVKTSSTDYPEYTRESYIRFNIDSIGTTVSATLRLFGGLDTTEVDKSVDIQIRDVTGSTLVESTSTYNTRPTVDFTAGGLLASNRIVGSRRTWYETDLTNFVRSEKNKGHSYFTLAIIAPDVSQGIVQFDSREGANGPELLVTS